MNGIDNAIYVEGLTKSFGESRALDGISLQVPAGQVFGLLGKNGAGKTTLLRSVMGLLSPDAGLARVFGTSMTSAGLLLRSRVAYVPQEGALFGELSTKEHARLFRAFYPRFDEQALGRFAERLEVDMTKRVSGLSGGSRRKAAVALALASGADLLMLDEPAAGLDPAARRELYDLLIDRLGEGWGATIVLSTHLVGDLERLADQVAVIDRGRALRVDNVEGYTDMSAGGFARVQVIFEGAAPLDFQIPGAKETVHNGRVALGVTQLAGNGEALIALEARPGVTVTRFALTLEEVFLELVASSRDTEGVSA